MNLNRRAFVASLFIAPIAPKLARLVSPPQLTLLQKMTLEMKRATMMMRRQIDAAIFKDYVGVILKHFDK